MHPKGPTQIRSSFLAVTTVDGLPAFEPLYTDRPALKSPPHRMPSRGALRTPATHTDTAPAHPRRSAIPRDNSPS